MNGWSRTLPIFAGVTIALLLVRVVDRSSAPPSCFESSAVPDDLKARAWEICRRIEREGLGRNCTKSGVSLSSDSFKLRFDPIPDAPAEGLITVFLIDRAAHFDDAVFPAIRPTTTPRQPFPELYMTSAPGIERGGWRVEWTSARWQACRMARTSTLCAAQYPEEYANAERLYDLTTRIAQE